MRGPHSRRMKHTQDIKTCTGLGVSNSLGSSSFVCVADHSHCGGFGGGSSSDDGDVTIHDALVRRAEIFVLGTSTCRHGPCLAEGFSVFVAVRCRVSEKLRAVGGLDCKPAPRHVNNMINFLPQHSQQLTVLVHLHVWNTTPGNYTSLSSLIKKADTERSAELYLLRPKDCVPVACARPARPRDDIAFLQRDVRPVP